MIGKEQPFREQDDYWAVMAWTNTIKKLDLNVDVAFYGNSLTYESNFHEIFKRDSVKLINLGYPGDDLRGLINRISMLMACKPSKIFLMAGINGLSNQSFTEFSSLYTELVDLIQEKLPSSELYLQSILPVNTIMNTKVVDNEKIYQANEIIKQIALKHDMRYIDLHSLFKENGMMSEKYTYDGLHLKQSAYQLWADYIHQYIIE